MSLELTDVFTYHCDAKDEYYLFTEENIIVFLLLTRLEQQGKRLSEAQPALMTHPI